jgi:outer membrane protein OmpA-like peptidoglycan-associated protein
MARLSLALATIYSLTACEALEPCPPPIRAQVSTFLVFFDFGSAKVTPQAMSVVRGVAKAMQQNDRVAITAHTDGSGDQLANLVLSYRRAEALRDAMATVGVSRTRVDLRAGGDQFPLVQTRAREPQNRRAEFTIIHTASDDPKAGWRREKYECIETKYRWVKQE